jgi:predicted thioesterase
LARKQLAHHASASAVHVVQQADLASELASQPGDFFVPVMSTPTMIGLMELAAARVLQPILEAGETSVGAGLHVQHTAPTLPGTAIRAEARFTGMEGKLYVFEVSCMDDQGEVGRGVHRRAIVDAERFMASVRRRASGG